MAGIFATSQAGQSPQITGLQIQTSVEGRCIPLVFGTTRAAPNLGWYGDFVAIAGQTSGKGGALAGKAGPGAPTYRAAVLMFLCQGEIAAIGQIFADKSVTSLSALGLTLFDGDYTQTPWGYLVSNHPTQALGYRGVAYAAASSYSLGQSAALPNHNFEIFGLRSASVAGQQDADPSLVVKDLLYETHFGAGFPSANVGTLATFQDYTLAAGLLISPCYSDQRSCADMLGEIDRACNSAFVFSNDLLTLVPYGDEAITGNGHTYTPPAAPLFDLDGSDFCPPAGDDPVHLVRSRPSDAINSIRREYLNRANKYSPATVQARDPAGIKLYGLRQDPATAAHLFTSGTPAQASAQLELQRQLVRNHYTFRLDGRYACLDPMDIVSLTDPSLQLDRQWVRITDLDQDEEGFFAVQAEQYLRGTGAAAAYDFETGAGYAADYNSTPDSAVAPVVFEPPQGLVNDLEVWLGTGGSGPNWGGCNVWVSTTGAAYERVGTIRSAAAIGELTATLPSVTRAVIGQTIDNTSTLSVQLASYGATLEQASIPDATALNTLCYVDGELLAFADVALTGPGAYDLTYLVRGAYDTDIAAHPAPGKFMKLDASVLKLSFPSSYVGTSVYIKLTSFNEFGGGEQSLGSVSAYVFPIVGQSVAGPLPDVLNQRAAFIDNKLWLYWDEIIDPRPVLYEIRKGETFESAQLLGRVAHPPVPVYGNDNYWIVGVSQPKPDITVYSPTPAEVIVGGSAISTNVVASHDEFAGGWPGTLDATLEVVAGNLATRSGDSFGYYTIGSGHRVNAGRVAALALNVSWRIVGQFVDADFLGVPDFLAQPDFLGLSATVFATGFPEYRLSQDGSTWGSWIKYAPGVYQAWAIDLRLGLGTLDPAQAIAVSNAFDFTVDVPDRVDFYPATATSGAGNTTVTFAPAAFNGGPGAASVPSLTYAIRNGVAGDDLVITSLSLSALVFSVYNAGSRVVRSVDLTLQGY